MQNAHPLITSGTGQYKAVCHKCQYVGFEPNCTTCRMCGFPLLLEPIESEGLSVRDILDRSSIEYTGDRQTPHLPGINRTERQRQEMLERARRRIKTITGGQPTLVGAMPDGRGSQPARLAGDTPVYSTREETFVFPAHQRAETYRIPAYSQPGPQVGQAGIGTGSDSRRRLGMVVMFFAALVAALATAASAGL
jgi:hypothetical protein